MASRVAVRRRRFLLGFLAGLFVSAFATPSFTLAPVTGDLIWALYFAIPAGLLAAILPVHNAGDKPTGNPDC
jgi:hypothetical protein